MDFFEVISARKAVRRFVGGKTMPEKDIQKILETISLAPSAKNLQSYKVFAVRSKKNIERVFYCCFSQRSDFIKNAALVLVFCTNPKEAEETFGKRGKSLYAIQDATIAASFAILTATALGFGSCWVGNFKEDEVQNLLKTKLQPVALVVIGYPDENPVRKPRKPLTVLSQVL